MKKALRPEPIKKKKCPARYGSRISGTYAEAVAYARVDVKLRGYMKLGHREIQLRQTLRDFRSICAPQARKAGGVWEVSFGSTGIAGYRSA